MRWVGWTGLLALVACGRIGFAPAGDASPTTYHDVTNAAYWSTFDLTTLGISPSGGVAFDGQRYLYIACVGMATSHPSVAQYDTTAPLGSSASWMVLDLTAVAPTVGATNGLAFDGRYLYTVPNDTGLVLRHDAQAPFATAASWATFDVTTVDPGATDGGGAFRGAVVAGGYVYFAPINAGGHLARYDRAGAFASGSSWSTFVTTAIDPNAKVFEGAVFDGQFVYLAPHQNGFGPGVIATRYDTTAAFASAGAWSTLDTTTVNGNARGFEGAAFDGQYVYFVPRGTSPYNGVVTRVRTGQPFTSTAAWAAFDLASINPAAIGFGTAAFDGRYIYVLPYASSGLLPRYDTTASFVDPASWTLFDITSVDPGAANGLASAAFDGRYVYVVGQQIARFDAKSPPALPVLPDFFGSFY